MEADFWLERWQVGQIGFHAEAPHPLLVQYWSTLGAEPAARVFVPLCGKSLDLVWLRQRGHAVVGVELSPLAIEAFFAERGLSAAIDRHGPFTRYRAAGYELLCGDCFALSPALLGPVAAIYDRAALIALSAALRTRYAECITALSAPTTTMLLITVQYAPDVITPPPFAIGDAEIITRYADNWALTRVADAATTVKGEAGTETVFALVRR